MSTAIPALLPPQPRNGRMRLALWLPRTSTTYMTELNSYLNMSIT